MQGYSSPLSIALRFLQRCPSSPFLGERCLLPSPWQRDSPAEEGGKPILGRAGVVVWAWGSDGKRRGADGGCSRLLFGIWTASLSECLGEGNLQTGRRGDLCSSCPVFCSGALGREEMGLWLHYGVSFCPLLFLVIPKPASFQYRCSQRPLCVTPGSLL